MKMNEPIGNIIYAPMLIRLSIGIYFVLAGLRKLDKLAEFVTVVEQFNVLPSQLAHLYATIIPYLEVAGGLLLVIGCWTSLAAILTSLMLISYIVAIGLFPHQSSELFNKDLIFLAGTLSLLYSGPGAYSIDGFRRSG